MGFKLAQGELNVTFKSIFMYIDNVYLTPSNVNFTKDYAKDIQKVSLATNLAGLTLNTGNYHFGCHKIKF